MPSNVQAHFSTRVNGVENVGNKARLRFTASRKGVQGGEGPSEEGFIDADVIVGADGVKSVIRTALQLPSPKHAFPSLEGKELPPASYRYTGTYCYRGLVPMDKVKAIEPEDQAVPNSAAVDRMWFAKDSHILTFPIEHGTVGVGRWGYKVSPAADAGVFAGPQRRRIHLGPLQAQGPEDVRGPMGQTSLP
jgi:salicylate hydroxylase